MQEPISVLLGTENKWKGSGERRVYKQKNEEMIIFGDL
jgi:hypothetical protein